ncbi:MAG TPA: RNA ligase (ATP) [Bacteroidales bacterium]|nr:RNA ligase (ATP) [Bacteroidales bacterium]
MRNLASIQRIKALEPIEGADAIEKASVLGWQLVVKKGEFNVGDLVVYCEIDSLMPDRPEFEFLKSRGMRIKTIRLRGQISQGICFPVSILPKNFEIKEGADCTDALGITKFEPPIPACLHGVAKGKFPSFIPKTDETRVQVLQNVLDKYQGELCYITEKLDGSSATYFIKDGEFGVASRNLELLEDDQNSFWKVAREMHIENKLLSLNKNFAIQGELVGEGVQSNKLRLRGQTVFFFTAFDIDKYETLPFQDFMQLMKEFELPVVPVIATDYKLENNMDALISMASIRSKICPEAWAEGIVIRSIREIKDPFLAKENITGGRLSFKVVNPEFLLKYGE